MNKKQPETHLQKKNKENAKRLFVLFAEEIGYDYI